MLAWTLSLAACKHEEEPPPPSDSATEEIPRPEAIATLNAQWVEPSNGGHLWLEFQNPARQEPAEPELDSCQSSRHPREDPILLDAGDLTVRIDRYIPLEW